MPDTKLVTVPQRPTWSRATVIDCIPGFRGPYFRGEGTENMLCGNCDTVLIHGRVVAMLTMYLCCPECGLYNLAHDDEDAASA
ncbi:MAG TPA: hypothetical protein VM370_02805 [Candidatus Thermoplasmatota archaeon]|nr:hypothetical protein [Candidatus Thermoplasmatota archaeon]